VYNFFVKQTTIENLRLVVDANKKEENAVEALRVELDRKSNEKSELVSFLKFLKPATFL
jgi:hypothetical protein